MNEAVNKMAQFLGTIQRGKRFVEDEVQKVEDLLAGGVITDHGLKDGISKIFSSLDHKTKLALGGMTAGGIGLAAWGAYSLFGDDEEQENIRQINSHFSSFSALNRT
jgi:hypothetical protein